MSQPYVAQIELFSFSFAPKGWSLCQGQTLQIAQNQALFALLGTAFGGNGQTTFALPDFRGRAPIGGTNPLGAQAGEETHTLLSDEIPIHTHTFSVASANGNVDTPAGNTTLAGTKGVGNSIPGGAYDVDMFVNQPPNSTMAAQTLATAGASQPHNNMMPFVALNFCIALSGVYPSRN
ncbi:MAG TPA: tail fiber protein [Rhizomicrobium sp.]|jgi:microcystin-dependent protein